MPVVVVVSGVSRVSRVSEAFEILGEPSESLVGLSWMRGSANGVPSNSAHPPRRPISTTRSNILVSSSFLQPSDPMRIVFSRNEPTFVSPLPIVGWSTLR